MVNLPNVQPTEIPKYDKEGTLEVIRVFPTIQGEGPDAGTPAVFVRLAGCNLDCPLCDTDYTTGRAKLGVGPLAQLITEGAEANHISLVVLTGGEPFRQNIAPLVNGLLIADFKVQIETNGTLFVKGLSYHCDDLSIVCSPKARAIHKELAPKVSAYKYVIEAGHVDPDDGLPTSVLGNEIRVARPDFNFVKRTQVFVQPMDPGVEYQSQEQPDDKALELDAKYYQNVQAAKQSCLDHGYRLSLQIHKILGMD